MIIQSTNKPIIVDMGEDVQGRPIRATLWLGGEKLAEWLNDDIIYDGNIIQLELEQAETKEFAKGLATLEIKWLNLAGKTEFVDPITIPIAPRFDKEQLND